MLGWEMVFSNFRSRFLGLCFLVIEGRKRWCYYILVDFNSFICIMPWNQELVKGRRERLKYLQVFSGSWHRRWRWGCITLVGFDLRVCHHQLWINADLWDHVFMLWLMLFVRWSTSFWKGDEVWFLSAFLLFMWPWFLASQETGI